MSDSDTHARGEHREDDYERRAVGTDPTAAGKWVSVLVALLGTWVLVESTFLKPFGGNLWSDVVLGATLVALGGYNYYRRDSEQLGSVGVGAFVALLGLWLVATPFVLGSAEGVGAVEPTVALWTDVVVGLTVFVLGAYSTYEARDTDVVTPAVRT